MSAIDRPDACRRILGYLLDAYNISPDSEVPVREIADRLDLPGDLVVGCVEYLVMEGLASADLFPVNVWVSLTDEGAAIAGRHRVS